jgi:hypothetical protein
MARDQLSFSLTMLGYALLQRLDNLVLLLQLSFQVCLLPCAALSTNAQPIQLVASRHLVV